MSLAAVAQLSLSLGLDAVVQPLISTLERERDTLASFLFLNNCSNSAQLSLYLSHRPIKDYGHRQKNLLSDLNTFKIHKSRGLSFLSRSPYNNENSNI